MLHTGRLTTNRWYGQYSNSVYKRLASCLATKWDQPYSPTTVTMSWLHCLTFSLLQSAMQCIRGAHSSCGHAAKFQIPSLDLVISELDLSKLSMIHHDLRVHILLIYLWFTVNQLFVISLIAYTCTLPFAELLYSFTHILQLLTPFLT